MKKSNFVREKSRICKEKSYLIGEEWVLFKRTIVCLRRKDGFFFLR